MDIIKKVLLILTISLGISAIPYTVNADVHNQTIQEEKKMSVTLPGKTIARSDVKTSDAVDQPKDNKIYSRGENTVEEVEFILSFYTTLPRENGGHTVTCTGKPLKNLDDAVASNVYPINTEIYLEKYGDVRVLDTGGRDFDSYNRLDVLIQRDKKDNGKWESDDEYLRRVNKMGHVKVKGWVKK